MLEFDAVGDVECEIEEDCGPIPVRELGCDRCCSQEEGQSEDPGLRKRDSS